MPNIITGFSPDYVYEDNKDKIDIEQLKVFYLFGIDLTGPTDEKFPDEMMEMMLSAAITQTENTFGIQVLPKTITGETHDYFAEDYNNWGFLNTYKKPISTIESLSIMYGSQQAYSIPQDWLRLSRINGQINLFPTAGSAQGLIIGSSGMFLGMNRFFNYAPHSWSIDYTAGMLKLDPTGKVMKKDDGSLIMDIPDDLKNYIYMLASISVMTVWGDLIIGAGIASQSIGLDGLSQSISTTQSAMFGGAAGRCEQYRKDMEKIEPVLRKRYTGIPMIVV